MVAKYINDLAGDKQFEHLVACSFVNDKGMDIRDIAHLVEELSEVVPIKENQALMELFLNQ